jgi:hypothetical protein
MRINAAVESLKMNEIAYKIQEALKSLKSLQVEMVPANATDLNSNLKCNRLAYCLEERPRLKECKSKS